MSAVKRTHVTASETWWQENQPSVLRVRVWNSWGWGLIPTFCAQKHEWKWPKTQGWGGKRLTSFRTMFSLNSMPYLSSSLMPIFSWSFWQRSCRNKTKRQQSVSRSVWWKATSAWSKYIIFYYSPKWRQNRKASEGQGIWYPNPNPVAWPAGYDAGNKGCILGYR